MPESHVDFTALRDKGRDLLQRLKDYEAVGKPAAYQLAPDLSGLFLSVGNTIHAAEQEPPEAIRAITDPTSRDRAVEIWRTTCQLLAMMGAWSLWLIQLRRRGTLSADESKQISVDEHLAGALSPPFLGRANALEINTTTCLRALSKAGAPLPFLRGRPVEEVILLFPVPPHGAVEPAAHQEFRQHLGEAERRLLEMQQQVNEFRKDLEQAPTTVLWAIANPTALATVEPALEPAATEPAQQQNGQAELVIVSLGKRQYQIGRADPITVEENEDCALQPFLNLASMDGPTLVSKAGFERAPRILNALKTKYNGMFAPAIRTPGSKGQGGYFVRIRAQVQSG